MRQVEGSALTRAGHGQGGPHLVAGGHAHGSSPAFRGCAALTMRPDQHGTPGRWAVTCHKARRRQGSLIRRTPEESWPRTEGARCGMPVSGCRVVSLTAWSEVGSRPPRISTRSCLVRQAVELSARSSWSPARGLSTVASENHQKSFNDRRSLTAEPSSRRLLTGRPSDDRLTGVAVGCAESEAA